MFMTIQWIKLIISLLVPQIIGFVGALFTTDSVKTWYVTIIKPTFNPPNWIFGPVWTLLFVLMGIGLYLVWSKGLNVNGVKLAIIIFAIQLALNLIWSILFFGLHNPLAALIEIFVLWVSILLMIIFFWQVSPIAAYLQIPYLLWVTFATILNFSIVLLN